MFQDTSSNPVWLRVMSGVSRAMLVPLRSGQSIECGLDERVRRSEPRFEVLAGLGQVRLVPVADQDAPFGDPRLDLGGLDHSVGRSEERRVGKECRSRW